MENKVNMTIFLIIIFVLISPPSKVENRKNNEVT